MTLGPALMLLGVAKFSSPWQRFLVVFGKVPLLFYVLHLFLLRVTSLPIAIARFGPLALAPPPKGTGASPELPLWVTYLAWLVTRCYHGGPLVRALKATKGGMDELPLTRGAAHWQDSFRDGNHRTRYLLCGCNEKRRDSNIRECLQRSPRVA